MKRVYKEYIDNIEFYYPYATEFADYSIAFFRLKYRTNQKPFQPKIVNGVRPQLIDVLTKDSSSKGLKSVFRNVNIDKSKYKLLGEEVAENTECNDWYEVTETYGYADTSANYYVKYSTASVFFIGSAMRDKLWGQTQYTEDGSYDYGFEIQDESWVAVPPNTQPIFPNDVFEIRRPYSSSTVFLVRSNEIVAQEANKLPIPIFTNIDYESGYKGVEVSAEEIFDAQKTNNFYRLTLILKERLSEGRNDTVVIETRTQFFDYKPTIIPRTKWVNEGGAEVDIEQDGSGFDPEAGLYDGKYCIEDSAISQDLATGLWRRDIKLTEWKVF